jgi:hypothetical protein
MSSSALAVCVRGTRQRYGSNYHEIHPSDPMEYALAACIGPFYRRLTSTDRNVPLSMSMEQEKVNNCAPFPRFARAVPTTTESLRPARLSTLMDSTSTDR